MTITEQKFKVGDRVLVEAIVMEVIDVPTNWPVRIVLDRGESKTVDHGGCVHYDAIHPLSHMGVEWQPIETAPKDGSRVLAWHEKWETSHTAQWYGTYWGVFYKTGPLLFQPTHWRPLPAPPVIAEHSTEAR